MSRSFTGGVKTSTHTPPTGCCSHFHTSAHTHTHLLTQVVKSVHYCEATKLFTTREYRDVTSLAGLPTSAQYPTKVCVCVEGGGGKRGARGAGAFPTGTQPPTKVCVCGGGRSERGKRGLPHGRAVAHSGGEMEGGRCKGGQGAERIIGALKRPW